MHWNTHKPNLIPICEHFQNYEISTPHFGKPNLVRKLKNSHKYRTADLSPHKSTPMPKIWKIFDFESFLSGGQFGLNIQIFVKIDFLD